MSENQLVEENIGLVDLFVNRLNYGYIEKEDLYQAGLMGLWEAAKKYNENKGVKFSTFASFYIMGEIKRELRENKLVKFSKKIYKIKRKVNNITNACELENIISEFNVQKEIVYDIFSNENSFSVSLDEDIINDYPSKSKKNIFKYAKECLDGIFLKVIEFKYINNYSQSEIAKMLNISQSKVSRIEKVSLKRLKNYYLNYNNFT